MPIKSPVLVKPRVALNLHLKPNTVRRVFCPLQEICGSRFPFFYHLPGCSRTVRVDVACEFFEELDVFFCAMHPLVCHPGSATDLAEWAGGAAVGARGACAAGCAVSTVGFLESDELVTYVDLPFYEYEGFFDFFDARCAMDTG